MKFAKVAIAFLLIYSSLFGCSEATEKEELLSGKKFSIQQVARKCGLNVGPMPHVEDQVIGMRVPAGAIVSFGSLTEPYKSFYTPEDVIVGNSFIPKDMTSCVTLYTDPSYLKNTENIANMFEVFGRNPVTGENKVKFVGKQAYLIVPKDGAARVVVHQNQILDFPGFSKKNEVMAVKLPWRADHPSRTAK